MSDQIDLFSEAIRAGQYVVLDTETTGLGPNAEIVSIAIVDAQGTPLLDTLVKPVDPIPASATAIHGITDEMVKDAPSWADVAPRVLDLIFNRPLFIYNAEFDMGMLEHSSRRWNLHIPWWSSARVFCAMQAYAAEYGEWSDYFDDYRWVKLGHACAQHHIPTDAAHGALGDAQMTAALIRKVWGGHS